MSGFVAGSQPNGNCGGLTHRLQADGERKDLAIGRGEFCDMAVRKIPEIPEDLVEKIIARMPFPSLFKARALSKSWYLKFPLPSSGVRFSTKSFEVQLASASSHWPIYCPIYLSADGILCFDKGCNQWRSMLTLSHLPVVEWMFVRVAGSLVCVFTNSDLGQDIFVTNVITKCWRKLPRVSSSTEQSVPDLITILPVGVDGYRVILVNRRYRRYRDGWISCVNTRSYESKLRTWTTKDTRVPEMDMFYWNNAYLDGKLYCMTEASDPDADKPLLWVHDIAGASWTAIPHRFTEDRIVDGAVLRCGNKVMVVVWIARNFPPGNYDRLSDLFTAKDSIRVYELDTQLLRLCFVGTGPPALVWGVGIHRDQMYFSSDKDFTYFGQAVPNSPVLTFNVHTLEWSCLPSASYTSMDKKLWGDTAFQPGLNPFAAV